MPRMAATRSRRQAGHFRGHVIALRPSYPGRVRTPTRTPTSRIRADYPSMFAGILKRPKPPMNCRGVRHLRTPEHMCVHHSHSWGSSGRRFKSCQPDRVSAGHLSWSFRFHPIARVFDGTQNCHRLSQGVDCCHRTRLRTRQSWALGIGGAKLRAATSSASGWACTYVRRVNDTSA
jgi:hypothetical protein